MRLYIYYWHGQLSIEQEKKLAEMGMYEEIDSSEAYSKYINMSIGEFAEKWKEKFIAFPRKNTSLKDNSDWLIGLTKFASFSQR